MDGLPEEPLLVSPVDGVVLEGPVAGMPADLAAAVFRLNDESQARAIATWKASGEYGQRYCRGYLSRARNRKHRQRRMVQALTMLISADPPEE